MSLPLTVTLSITYSPAAPVSDLAPTQASPPPVPFPLSSPFYFIFRVPPGRKPPSGATPPPFRSSPHFPGSARHAPALPDVSPPRPRISIRLSFCTHTLTPTPTLVPVLYSIFCASPVLGLLRNALWIPSSPYHRPTRVERRAALTRIPPGRWRSEGAPARLRTRTAAEWAHGGNGKDRVVVPLRPPGHRPRPAPAGTWHSRAGRRWAREPGKTGPRRPRPPGSRAAF